MEKIKLLIYLLSIRISVGNHSSFILSYTKHQTEFMNIEAFLCWDYETTKSLYGLISDENKFINIQNPLNTTQINKGSKIYVLDLQCKNFEAILKMANLNNYFGYYHQWLILIDSKIQLNKSLDYFKFINILTNSRVVLSEISDGTYKLTKIYKHMPDGEIFRDYLGDWRSGKFNFPPQKFMGVRTNLHNMIMKTAFVYTEERSLNHLTDYKELDIDSQLKLNYVLTGHMYDYFNATRSFKFVYGWGQKEKNGSYSGLIGEIIMNRIHISGSPAFCVIERAAVADCVSMTTPVSSNFVFRRPPLSHVADIYTLPFNLDVWLINLAFFLASVTLLRIAAGWERHHDKLLDNQLDDNLSEAFLFTLSAVCQQGYNNEPKGLPGKITAMTIFLTLTFVFTAYSANTVVLFQSSAANINTLKDLHESGLQLGVDDKPYFRYWFPQEGDPIKRTLYKEHIAPKDGRDGFYPVEEGVHRMRMGLFAFYVDDTSAYSIISETFQEHEKCGLETIPYLGVQNPWIMTPKNSTFYDTFKIGYRLIDESGIQLREIRKIFTQKPQCIAQGSNFRSASLLDLRSIYILFVIGLVASTLLLIGEILYDKHRNTKIYRY